jgi:hypothetical protein
MKGDIYQPDDQATAADYADVGKAIDALEREIISVTVVNLTTSAQMYYKVLGANQASFIDAQVVQAEATLTVSSGQTPVGSFSSVAPLWRYYKVQVKLIGAPTTCRVTWIMKG